MANKRPTVVQIALWLLLIVCIANNASLASSSNSNRSEENKVQSPCNERERQALLKFKHTLNASDDTLTSWVGDDCCSWMGVGCHSKTGHVIKLNLSHAFPYSPEISGEIDPSLLELKHLSYFDLSYNYFGFKPIPKFLGSFTKLRYLNLSHTAFSGTIPHQLGNLSSLHYLDLNRRYSMTLNADNLQWLSHLSSLKYLDMGGVNLSMAADWLQAINMIPSLSELHLSYCDVRNFPTLPHLNFTSLTVLNLFDNSFTLKSLDWLGNLSSLQYLNMGRVNLSMAADWLQTINMIPSLFELHLSECDLRNFPTLPHLNLTSLTVLDLSHNSFTLKSLHWLGNLSSLKYLHMESVNLSLAAAWLQAINMIHSLSELHLSYCDLGNFPTVPHLNLTSLTVLDLSLNSFTLKSLDWLGNLSSLVTLDLSIGSGVRTPSSLSFASKSSDWLSQLPNLESLFLRGINISGTVPESLGQLSNLVYLDLSSNSLEGTVPESLGQLSNLVDLDLSFNSFEGVISEAHFANLTRLESLDMSENSIAFNVSPRWIPPFQLNDIRLGSCQLGPQFPTWLQFMKKDDLFLNLSNSKISNAMPNWFCNLSSLAFYVALSHNQIYGELPSSLDFRQDADIDFSSNLFEGFLPQNVSGALQLDLSNNLFLGPINMSFGNIESLSLSSNHLHGSIPSSICGSKLQALDLSKNNLTGQIPLCLRDSSVVVLDLSYNNLNGVIPNIFGSYSLRWLQLSHNNLSGVISSSIRNRTYLEALDLSKNRLSGSIPKWIGESQSQLSVLNLRSNMFNGSIPPQLSLLSSLQILDLADNRLSGKIPSSFGNFTSMTMMHEYGTGFLLTFGNYRTYGMVVMKQREMIYTGRLLLVHVMDLSSNSLSGEIPKELTSLCGLESLNLSGNHLEGKIQENKGSLQQLFSLDLSQNQLSGEISSSISALTFLSSLNLSNNNLSGRIPSGYQLQTLIDPSIYAGNIDLCGKPLSKLCPGEEVSPAPNTDRGEDEKEGSGMWWFYVGVAPGFVAGFWLVYGILIFNKSWRIAYYRFFDRLNEQLIGFYVNILVKVMMKLKGLSNVS